MKQLSILLFSLLSFAYAQKGSISGKVLDTAGHKKVPLATITVFNAADTSIVTYRLSDENGAFRVPGLPLDKALRFIVTYSGYDAYRKAFTLTAARPDVPFDSIILQPSSKELDDVVVLAERPPVMIKNDTIEFNANSFKTLPNALVEDLLKKLPGVQVDKDGNITVNGKPVNRIMVDGKNFFGGDPKMATRNLPANIIDKIQVTDDKEELERSGDNNLNNVGKVVNIKLKKGVKKGVFGKLYAGGGTDKRYEAGGIANLFRDTLQISVLGYSNSLNKPGFSYNEIMQSGGFERNNASLNNRNSSVWYNSSGSSGLSINGINFGGSQGANGISTSTGGGININHSPNAKQSIFGQYFYGNVKVDRRSTTNLGQYNQDTVVTNNTNLLGDIITNAHSFGLGTKLKPDSVTTLMANANYTIGLQDESINRQVSAVNNIRGPLSQGSVVQGNEINTYLYKHNISYTRLSKKEKGRRLSANHGLSVSNGVNNYATDALIRYINPTPYDSLLQQMRYERIPSTEAFASLTYRDPLSKSFTLTAGTRYEYTRLSNRVNTYSRIGSSGEYDKYNPVLSSEFNRQSHRSSSSIGIEYKWKDLIITPTVRGLWQKVDNQLASLLQPIRQNQFNLLPALSVVYKQININYDRGVVLPAYTYLIPVLNNTNPYYVVKGNPNLLPATVDNLSTNWYQNFPKKNLNLSLWASVSTTKNAVIQSVVVDDKGVQTTTPVNADGSRSVTLNYNLNKQYKKGNRSLSWNIGAWAGYNRSRLLYNGENSWQATTSMSNWAGINLNLNDKLEWNNSYWISNNFSRFTSPQFKNLNTMQQTLASEMIVRVPKHIIWETNVNYEFNGSVPAGLPRNSFRISAAVNLTMLKDEKGVLRLSVWDILNRNNQVSYYAYRNTVTASQSNALTRYFMVTFTYNIRSIGGAKKKVGGGGIFGY